MTTTVSSSTGSPTQPARPTGSPLLRPGVSRGAVVALACVCASMVVIDTSIVNVALPSVRASLHLTVGGRQWVVNAYLLTLGGFLLLGARASDLFGRRRVLLIGIAVFLVGSLAGGLATSGPILLAARAVQGLGGSVLAPSGMALIIATHPEGEARGIIACNGTVLTASTFFVSQVLQNALGYDALGAGLRLIPFVVTSGAVAFCSARVVTRFGPRSVLLVGLLAAAAGYGWLGLLGTHPSYAANLLGPLTVIGAGLGLTVMPAVRAAAAGVPPHEAVWPGCSTSPGRSVRPSASQRCRASPRPAATPDPGRAPRRRSCTATPRPSSPARVSASPPRSRRCCCPVRARRSGRPTPADRDVRPGEVVGIQVLEDVAAGARTHRREHRPSPRHALAASPPEPGESGVSGQSVGVADAEQGGGETTATVVLALGANVAVMLAKIVGGAISGSAALLSEGAHSAADVLNEIFLLLSLHRSRRPADSTHPFGYGMERFFWSLLAAVGIFVSGAGFALYEGIEAIRNGADHTSTDQFLVVYVVLGVSALLEGSSLLKAIRQVRGEARAAGRRVLTYVIRSPDPTVKTVASEDSAAVLGIVIAATGTALHQATGRDVWEGVASLVIAALLAYVAVTLGRDTKELLIGEAADPAVRLVAIDVIAQHQQVERIAQLLTMQLGPSNVLVAARLQFVETAGARDIEQACTEIEREMHDRVPALTEVFLDPSSVSDEQQARAGELMERSIEEVRSLDGDDSPVLQSLQQTRDARTRMRRRAGRF